MLCNVLLQPCPLCYVLCNVLLQPCPLCYVLSNVLLQPCPLCYVLCNVLLQPCPLCCVLCNVLLQPHLFCTRLYDGTLVRGERFVQLRHGAFFCIADAGLVGNPARHCVVHLVEAGITKVRLHRLTPARPRGQCAAEAEGLLPHGAQRAFCVVQARRTTGRAGTRLRSRRATAERVPHSTSEAGVIVQYGAERAHCRVRVRRADDRRTLRQCVERRRPPRAVGRRRPPRAVGRGRRRAQSRGSAGDVRSHFAQCPSAHGRERRDVCQRGELARGEHLVQRGVRRDAVRECVRERLEQHAPGVFGGADRHTLAGHACEPPARGRIRQHVLFVAAGAKQLGNVNHSPDGSARGRCFSCPAGAAVPRLCVRVCV